MNFPSPPLSQMGWSVDPAPLPATENMALDEARLECNGGPSLRFYRWERPTISFGCFQSWREVAARFPAREWVRRPTGGGAVEHGDPGETATYSLVIPREGGALAGWRERPAGVFRRIHAALGDALGTLGMEVDLYDGDQAPGLGGACFHDRPVPGDLVHPTTGQKIAGAAQRRTRAGLLHQGSLRVPGGLDVIRLAEKFAGALASKPVRQVNIAPEVADLARALVETKYSQRAWTERC